MPSASESLRSCSKSSRYDSIEAKELSPAPFPLIRFDVPQIGNRGLLLDFGPQALAFKDDLTGFAQSCPEVEVVGCQGTVGEKSF